MGYSSNKKFSAASDMIGVIIDGCGNTYEDKYYVNGTYVDLCGLSIKDYMNNPCCGNCGGGSSSGDELPNGKRKNTIKIEVFEKDGYIYYRAVATYPVTSVLKIRVVSADNNGITELDIYPGETTSAPEKGETLEITDVSVDVTEDDNFQYTPTNGNEDNENETPEEVTYNIYVATLHLNDIENITTEFIEKLQSFVMDVGTTVDMTFIIPGTDINYYDMESEDFVDFCENNQYGFIITIPKFIYDNGGYTIYNYGGSDMTHKFVLDSTHKLNTVEYVCLVEKALDDIMPYVPLYKEDIKYEYKLTLINKK